MNSKGMLLNLNILKFPLTKKGSVYGSNLILVMVVKIHRHILTVTLGIFSVNRLIILLKVYVPVMKSPPPKNYNTLMSSSEVKFL